MSTLPRTSKIRYYAVKETFGRHMNTFASLPTVAAAALAGVNTEDIAAG